MQSTPYTTGAAAISGAMLGSVIAWLCGCFHVPAPPPDVAGTIGGVALAAGHALATFASGYLRQRAAIAAPAAPPAPASLIPSA